MDSVTIGTIITEAKYKSDMTNSQFITDAEWLSYAKASAKWYYDLLVDTDEDYFISSTTISTNGTSDLFNLPSDFFKLKGVDYDIGGDTVSMEKFTFVERNRYRDRATKLRYRLVGSQIQFKPVPSAQTITLWYIPTLTIADTSSTILSVNGWSEFVVLDVAIKALLKEESDASSLMAERDVHTKRLMEMKANRDYALPERVSDVYRLDIHPRSFNGEY